MANRTKVRDAKLEGLITGSRKGRGNGSQLPKGVFLLKKIFSALLLVIALASNILAINAAEMPAVDIAKLDSGVVAVSGSSAARLKVTVEKNGERIAYDLRNDGVTEYYPLQMGEGSYKVSVLENVGGTKYKYVETRTIALDLDDANDVYLASVQNINWNWDMKAIKKAGELTKGLNTEWEKVNAIYEYLISNIKYDYDKLKTLKSGYLPDIDDTLEKGKGICYDYSSIFAAMLRSQGIPAKLVKGYTPTVDGYHAWNEIYMSDSGKWITADLTYDAKMKSEKKEYSLKKMANQYTKVFEY